VRAPAYSSHSPRTHARASQYLETLCDYLYDDLRPRILHEPRLTALCEVCTVLQALAVLDAAPALGGSEDDDDADDADAADDDENDDEPRLSVDLEVRRVAHARTRALN
jgi:hypothetical protein